MQLYSKRIIKFIGEIKRVIKDVIAKEVRLKVHADRFYDSHKRYSYPLKVVIYNHRKMLGYFDPRFYELGFHACLMQASKEQLHNIIRHELAHYITFIESGLTAQPHGAEFKDFCHRMGWGEEVYRASSCLDDGAEVCHRQENGVLRKVQKLIALASSSNQHESEQAMIKSQQLLLKHNIDAHDIPCDDDEKIVLKRILEQKKENAKMRSIAIILETFFVSVIYARGAGAIYLEIMGSAANVEIAEYVADFLCDELDKQWVCTKLQHAALKGMVAKNSFFLGIAKGYCDKINFLKKAYDTQTTNALMVIEKKLVDAKAMVYARLSSSKSSARCCHASSALGERVGKLLTIRPGIPSSTRHSGASLNYVCDS